MYCYLGVSDDDVTKLLRGKIISNIFRFRGRSKFFFFSKQNKMIENYSLILLWGLPERELHRAVKRTAASNQNNDCSDFWWLYEVALLVTL